MTSDRFKVGGGTRWISNTKAGNWRKIVEISSDPGDVVLELLRLWNRLVAAQNSGRHWIGIDIFSYCLPGDGKNDCAIHVALPKMNGCGELAADLLFAIAVDEDSFTSCHHSGLRIGQ